MKKFLFILISLLLLSSCATMYNLDLVSDESENLSINTQYPNYINMLVRVTDGKITTTDQDGNRIPDFSNPDYYVVDLEPTLENPERNYFSILENQTAVKVEAGLRVVPLEELELHIIVLLDVSGSVGEAGLIQAKNAVKRLFARPCTQDEIDSALPGSFPYSYTAWDSHSSSFIEKNEVWVSTLKQNQIVTIYAFADTVQPVALRQLDSAGNRYPDKARQLLDTIDKQIQLGVDSTNLYGAYLAGLSELRAIRSLDDPKRGFVDGMIIAFTDGAHTSGDIRYKGQLYTPTQAIQRIHGLRGELTDLQSLRIINIAVKSPELQETITQGNLAGGGLRDIQNAGYLRVDKYNQLSNRFADAFELIDRYTRSLYWIYYRTPKTGYQDVDIDLRVGRRNILDKKGENIPDYARIYQTIQTDGFYQVLPGVYINDPILDTHGQIAELFDDNENNLAYQGTSSIQVNTQTEMDSIDSSLYSLITANNPNRSVMNRGNTELLRIHTYVRANNNRYKPLYQIVSSDESIVAVIGHTSLTVIESVALIECRKPGTATIEVTDLANGNLVKTIVIESNIDQ
ncbi:MAG: hypothetical protein PF447_01140 [Spirochaetaceae bacterium]|jgi:hypothetical protein|nr:hypothetical protein [Spirochaetaceae bacterium]